MWPNLPHSKQVKLGEDESFFLNFFLCWKDFPLEFFLFKNLLNFLTSRVRFLLLELSTCSSSLDGMENFGAKPLLVFSLASSSIILVMSISHSLNFPNSSAWVIDVRSLDTETVVTFDCQFLLRDFKIFTFSFSSSNSFPRPLWWFTMWVNLFWISQMVSPYCILQKDSYSWMREFFLALITFGVPS